MDFQDQEDTQFPDNENLYKIAQSQSKQIRVLKGANDYLNESLQLKDEEIRELKSEVDTWKTRKSYSKEKVIHPEDGESISIEPNPELIKEISELKSQVENLQKENKNFQSTLNSKNTEIEKIKLDNAALEKEIKDSKLVTPVSNTVDNSKLETANARIKELETEIGKYKPQINELEKTVTTLKSENAILEKERDEAKKTSSANTEVDKGKLETANTRIKELESEIGKYKPQINELDKTIASLKEDIIKLSKEKEELLSKNSNANNGIKESYDKLIIEYDKIKALNINIEPGIFI
jgi:chromosome segregation ATPase